MNEFFAFYLKNAQGSQAALEGIADALRAESTYQTLDLWVSPRGHLGLLNVTSDSDSEPHHLKSAPWGVNRLRTTPRMAWVRAGYMTADPSHWEATVHRTAGELSCEDAGGIGAFAVAFFDRGDEDLFLWSTRPGLRSIAYAEASDMWIAGTRPYRVHRIAQAFGATVLDTSYVMESLTGWSLRDRTPFDRTSLIPVDALLKLDGSTAAQRRHPTGTAKRSSSPFSSGVIESYQTALRAAVEPLRKFPGFELRLSGGKDSRLIAAALHNAKIKPTTVICHGLPGEWEIPVAEQVAEALGWELKLAMPEYAFRGNELETIRYNLTMADGFLATEALQSPYAQIGISGDRGPGLILGHMELQRGGWATQKFESFKEVSGKATGRLFPLRDCVAPWLFEVSKPVLQEAIASLNSYSPTEAMYWINYRFRVCRWLISHYLLHSRFLIPVYPLVDERVVRVVNQAPMSVLTSEELIFRATSSLAPPLREMPLFRERYRFETDDSNPRLKREVQRPEPTQPGPSTYLKREVVLPGRIGHMLCEHIRNGRLRDEIKEASTPAVWQAIENPSREQIEKTNVVRKRFCSYLWTCFQASVLHTDGLLPESSLKSPVALGS